jgi:hypothetical protein
VSKNDLSTATRILNTLKVIVNDCRSLSFVQVLFSYCTWVTEHLRAVEADRAPGIAACPAKNSHSTERAAISS